jgi:hypothetical protein
MRYPATALLLATFLVCTLSVTVIAQLAPPFAPYSQDLELLSQADISALANDGSGFCQIDLLQGGIDQGVQQLSIFSDYRNQDHAEGRIKEGLSTATALIQTIDPNNSFSLTNLVAADMTAIPVEWGATTLSLTIDAALVGQYFQVGFACKATLFQGSGIFFDNVVLELGEATGIPDSSVVAGAVLEQNSPNPFNSTTKIDFELEKAGNVELAVYDLAGRLVATLEQGALDAGEHSVVWNRRSEQRRSGCLGPVPLRAEDVGRSSVSPHGPAEVELSEVMLRFASVPMVSHGR